MVCKAEGIFLAFHCRRIWQKGSILKYPSKQVEGYDLALLETQIIFPLTDFSFLCSEVRESKSNWGLDFKVTSNHSVCVCWHSSMYVFITVFGTCDFLSPAAVPVKPWVLICS